MCTYFLQAYEQVNIYIHSYGPIFETTGKMFFYFTKY